LEDRHNRKAFKELQFVLIGMGIPEDFGGTNRAAGMSLPLGESRVWRSLTPFVPTRHAKGPKGSLNVQEAACQNLQRLLETSAPSGALPLVEEVSPEMELPPWIDLGRRHSSQWRQFRTRRERGKGLRAGTGAYGFRIRFAEPVRGPLAFGYGAHYGLGLFVPEN
jgi:CRISPR-associated protein Csb2